MNFMRKATNDYGLGDVIKRATAVVGFKPCTGCQKRAEWLNDWGRRSFIGRALMFPFILKASFARAVTSVIDGDISNGLAMIRLLNVAQVRITTIVSNPDGSHLHVPGSKAAMLAYLAAEVQEADATTADGAFLRILAPNDPNSEALAGWIVDFDVKPGSYVLINSRKVDQANPNATRDVLITDENGVIYRSQVSAPTQPTAASLDVASAFPGAVPWDKFAATQGTLSKARSLFKTVVYRFNSGRPDVSNCIITHSSTYCYCTELVSQGGCGGLFCQVGRISCPGCLNCLNWVDCCPTGLIYNGCFKNPGAGDCGWCAWFLADGKDCSKCRNCPEVAGTDNCCRCPIPRQCGCT
jgi:hypothetical protein